jgi:hypothetical protein
MAEKTGMDWLIGLAGSVLAEAISSSGSAVATVLAAAVAVAPALEEVRWGTARIGGGWTLTR